MADNKGKTKAAILHELESIKGLLLEEDEIPILQEMIPGADGKAKERPLPKRDLDELHDVFQALSHTIKTPAAKTPVSKPLSKPSSRQQGLLDAFVQPHTPANPAQQKAAIPQGKPLNKSQPSLFNDELEKDQDDDFDQDYLNEDTVDLTEPENLASPGKRGFDYAFGTAKNPAEGVGSQPLNYAVNKSITSQRPTLTKASGENPFLPQHIRARLHGNNPPPLFEMAITEKSSVSPAVKTPAETSGRQQLIRDLVAAVMPQVEQELRQRLQSMTDEQLQELLQERE